MLRFIEFLCGDSQAISAGSPSSSFGNGASEITDLTESQKAEMNEFESNYTLVNYLTQFKCYIWTMVKNYSLNRQLPISCQKPNFYSIDFFPHSGVLSRFIQKHSASWS